MLAFLPKLRVGPKLFCIIGETMTSVRLRIRQNFLFVFSEYFLPSFEFYFTLSTRLRIAVLQPLTQRKNEVTRVGIVVVPDKIRWDFCWKFSWYSSVKFAFPSPQILHVYLATECAKQCPFCSEFMKIFRIHQINSKQPRIFISV